MAVMIRGVEDCRKPLSKTFLQPSSYDEEETYTKTIVLEFYDKDKPELGTRTIEVPDNTPIRHAAQQAGWTD